MLCPASRATQASPEHFAHKPFGYCLSFVFDITRRKLREPLSCQAAAAKVKDGPSTAVQRG